MITSPTIADYTVIFWNPNDHRQWGPTEIHRKKGATAKDMQDGIAAYAGDHPEIIYMVVLTEDYRNFYRNMYAPKEN